MIRRALFLLAVGAAFGQTYLPVLEPQALQAGPVSNVRVSVRVAGEPSRVDLYRVDGPNLAMLGPLTDDGRGADRRPGDAIYSGSFPLGLSSPGLIWVRAIATVNGKSVASPDSRIEMFPAGVPLVPARGDAKQLLEDRARETSVACDELRVIAEPGTSTALLANSAARIGGVLGGLTVMRTSNIWSIRIPCAGSVAAVAEIATALAADGWQVVDTTTSEFAGITVTDPELGSVARQITIPRANIAWTVTLGGPTVAVVDTGADFSHEDLQGRLIPGVNFASGPENDLNDRHYHGTGMAGLIAANAFNGIGIAGIAPASSVLVVRVSGGLGAVLNGRAADGIRYAAAQGAPIINCSFAGPLSDHGVAEAIDYANSTGALVVTAAGNRNGRVHFPAAFPDVSDSLLRRPLFTQTLSVGGHEFDGTHWVDEARFGSAYGPELDMDALSDDVTQTMPPSYDGRLYARAAGTSGAAALVSGAASLVLAARPSLSRETLFSTLVNTAVPTGFSHPDGTPIRRLDAFHAVFQAVANGSCAGCPGSPDVSARGATVFLARQRSRADSQPASINAAYLPLRPASAYRFRFSHEFNTFDSYRQNAHFGGFFDSFSVSLARERYHLRTLTDPLTESSLNAAIVWGAGTNLLQTPVVSTGTIDTTLSSTLPGSIMHLSIVLDTFTLPDRSTTLPSWGTVTVEDITPIP